MEHSIHEQFLGKLENRRLYQQEKALIDATELLAEVMERKQMSRADLARAIGKSKAFVTQVLRGNQNMTLRTLADLFGAMRYEIVIQALPFPEDQTQIPDLKEATAVKKRIGTTPRAWRKVAATRRKQTSLGVS